jgi:hypothetical protein
MAGWRVTPVDKPGSRFSRPGMLQKAEKAGFF